MNCEKEAGDLSRTSSLSKNRTEAILEKLTKPTIQTPEIPECLEEQPTTSVNSHFNPGNEKPDDGNIETTMEKQKNPNPCTPAVHECVEEQQPKSVNSQINPGNEQPDDGNMDIALEKQINPTPCTPAVQQPDSVNSVFNPGNEKPDDGKMDKRPYSPIRTFNELMADYTLPELPLLQIESCKEQQTVEQQPDDHQTDPIYAIPLQAVYYNEDDAQEKEEEKKHQNERSIYKMNMVQIGTKAKKQDEIVCSWVFDSEKPQM